MTPAEIADALGKRPGAGVRMLLHRMHKAGDIIKRAVMRYKGYKPGFGAWPRSFMEHKSSPRLTNYHHTKRKLLEKGKHPSQHAIRSTGVLAGFMLGRSTKGTRAAFDRTEQLLRLLLANAKPNPRKPRFGLGVGARRHHLLEISEQ